MNISERMDVQTSHMRRINGTLYWFKHYSIPGDNSATYVYRREFSGVHSESHWVEVKVVRFWNEA